MSDVVKSKIDEIRALCLKHKVRRMSVFGSAATDGADANDIDLLVEFRELTPAEHADSYFGLMEDLEQLLGMPVDLVEPGPIRNPYFRRAVEETKRVLYDGA